ncbi:ABC transporter permease [Nanoarchaeota archaeon]
MKNIFRLIKKNLKLLIRAKSSALIIILAPLLVILLIGIAFDNANTYGLNIGTYTPTANANVDSFISKLSEKEFKIIQYEEEQECINNIKLGSIHTCIVFPENFNFDNNEQKKITFFIDYSKINLVWMIMDTLSTKFTSRSQEISQDLTSIVLNKLEGTETELNAKKPIVVDIKNSNDNMLIKAQEIDNHLASLDLSFSENIAFGSSQNMVTNIKDSISDNIDSSEDYIAAAQDIISDSGASQDDKDDAIAELENALEDLDNIGTTIHSTTDNNSLTRLSTLITNVSNGIEATKTKLANAASAKASSQQKLVEIETALSQSLSNLATIETSIDQLLSDIGGVRVTSAATITSPITTEIKPISTQKTYLNYLFPSLMVLVIMFISILLGTTLVMMEKHSNAHFRNFISPTRNIIFVISTYLTNMFLVVSQIAIILVIAIYFFSAQILPSLPLALVVLIASATLFSLLGMAVGYMFSSEETGTLAAISIGSLCLFLSSVIIPIESMPSTIRKIVAFNPFVISERVLREIILFQPKISYIADDLFLLLGYALILFLFIWGSQRLFSHHLFHKIKYKHHKKVRNKKHKKSKAKEQVTTTKTESPKEPTPKKTNPSRIRSSPKQPHLDNELERINKELSELR